MADIAAYPTQIITVAEAFTMVIDENIDPIFQRLRVHIPHLSHENISVFLGCQFCGKSCTCARIQQQEAYNCLNCGLTTKAQSKIYFQLDCTDGTTTISLNAYTKTAEKILRIDSETFYTMSSMERRNVIDRALVRINIHNVDIIIAPVKSLLRDRMVTKWYLKDVLG